MRNTVSTSGEASSSPADVEKSTQQGHLDAIASWINQTFQPKGIKTALEINGDHLHLALKSERPLSQSKIAQFIQQGFKKLGVTSISKITIYGLLPNSSTPAWRKEIILNQPSNPLSSKSPSPQTPQETPKQTEAKNPDPVINRGNGEGSSVINAHVQAQTISGQVAIGNHILQIGHMSGGVVNFASNEPRKPQAIDTPIYLTPRPFPNLLDRTDIMQAINGAFQGWQSTECFSPSGLGKTSLLRYIAHHLQLTAFFPDGVVYLLARRQPKSDLLYALFNAFYEADADYKPTDVHLRRLLQSKKALILLDDVDLDRDDVQGLLDAVPNCLFVFTSEAQQLWGDDGISLPLKGLPIDDAIALVERTLHHSLSPVEMKDARILCERLDGHPLQILQTLAVMKQKRWTIAHLLHQIPSAAAADPFTVQAAESLSEPQKRVLSALTVLGGVSVGVTPLSALAAVPESDIDPVLQSLSDAHLIQVNAQDSDLRYRIAENLVDDFQQLWNLNDWVEATIEFFKTWVSQVAQGQQEILAEADTLIQVLEVAVQQGRWSDVLSLGNMMDAPLTLSHQWGRWERSLQYMLEAAQAIQNPTAEAWAMHQLGTQALCLENVSTAHHYLSQALTLREGLGDVIGANITRHNLNFLITFQAESEPDESGSPESVDPEPISVPATSEIAGQESIRIGLWLSRIFLFLAPLVFGSGAIWYFFLRASALEFIPSVMEFPEIEVGTTVETEQIRIENTGERVLQVSDVILVGRHVDDFALIEDTCSQRVTLQPTESCIVTIQFQPMNAGRRTARLSIAYEDGQKVQHLLVEGVGTAAEIKFNPNRIAFADLETGEESRAESITIQNTGTADLRISSIELVGDNTNAFTLLDNGCSVVADSRSVRSGSIIEGIEEVSSQMSQDHAALAIAPGETCTLSIQFTPSSAGTHTAELVVDSNALGEPESYVIQGTGLIIPRLDVDPTEAITFQSQEVGTTSEIQTITLTSNGTDAVTIDQLELQGNHRDDFVLSSSCIGQSIEPGEPCTLSIEFKPSEPGARTATLRVVSNAENEVAPISLQGTGTVADIQLSTNSFTVAPQEINTISNWESIQLTNEGDAPLRISNMSLTGSGAEAFEWNESCREGAIAHGDSCEIQVRFAPIETGTHRASIDIDSNALNAPEPIQLSGEGIAAEIAIATREVIFAPQEIRTPNSSQSLQIRNEGTAPLTIDSITGLEDDAAFSISGCVREAIAPGNTCNLTIIFSPVSPGQKTAQIALNSNAQNGAQIVTLSGVVTSAILDVGVEAVQFDPLRLGTSARRLLQIRNRGDAPLRIQDIESRGHTRDFSITGCSNIIVQPGENCQLAIDFIPQDEGDRSAVLTIASNAENELLRLPIQGTGAISIISVRPERLSFGEVPVQTSKEDSFSVMSTGTTNLTIEQLTIIGPHASDFRLANCSHDVWPPGQGCNLRVSFTPSGEGVRTATITIPSDAANGIQRIIVTGRGVVLTPRIEVTPRTISFGGQSIATSSNARSFTVKNIGTDDLEIGDISVNISQPSMFTGEFTLSRPEFSVSNCSGATLPPGQSCELRVEFTPHGRGERSATITIPSNAENGIQRVTVTGQGVPIPNPQTQTSSPIIISR